MDIGGAQARNFHDDHDDDDDDDDDDGDDGKEETEGKEARPSILIHPNSRSPAPAARILIIIIFRQGLNPTQPPYLLRQPQNTLFLVL